MNSLRLIHANLLSQTQYRLNFVGYVGMLFLLYGMKFLFLDSLFQFTGDIAGWSKNHVLFTFYLTIMLAVLGDIFDTSIFTFYRKAVRGELQPYLLKPMPISQTLMLRWCRPSSFLIFLILIPFGVSFYDPVIDQSFAIILLAVICFFAGLVANLLLISLLNLGCLLTQRQLPVDYIFSELYRLTQLPPGIFPPALMFGLAVLLPSIFCASVPAAVILHGEVWLGIVFLVGVGLLAGLHTLLFRRAMRSFDMLGG